MTTVADLVTVLHGIDAHRGEFCGRCAFYQMPERGYRGQFTGPRTCQKGYRPAGPTDGCDDWQPRPPNDRQTQALAAVVMSV